MDNIGLVAQQVVDQILDANGELFFDLKLTRNSDLRSASSMARLSSSTLSRVVLVGLAARNRILIITFDHAAALFNVTQVDTHNPSPQQSIGWSQVAAEDFVVVGLAFS